MHVYALVPHLADFARNFQGVAQLHGVDIVDGVVRNEHANLGPIPSLLAHSLPPPMNARLFHVNDVSRIVHDAIGVNV